MASACIFLSPFQHALCCLTYTTSAWRRRRRRGLIEASTCIQTPLLCVLVPVEVLEYLSLRKRHSVQISLELNGATVGGPAQSMSQYGIAAFSVAYSAGNLSAIAWDSSGTSVLGVHSTCEWCDAGGYALLDAEHLLACSLLGRCCRRRAFA